MAPAKQNYEIWDCEMLAIIEALKDWRCRGAVAQTRHEGGADGEVDDEVRRSESRSDEQLIQLSVLTKVY